MSILVFNRILVYFLKLLLRFLALISRSALPTTEEPASWFTEEQAEELFMVLLLTPEIDGEKGSEEADLEEEVKKNTKSSEDGKGSE